MTEERSTGKRWPTDFPPVFHTLRILFFIYLFLYASACNPLHTPRKLGQISPGPELREAQWSVASPDAVRVDRWWTVFNDEGLNAAIGDLHRRNLNLKQAWTRLSQAAALTGKVGAARLPQIDASVSATRSKNYGPTGQSAVGNQFGASVAASYELDVWGRLSALERSAKLNAMATRLDVESLYMALTAQLAQTWFDLIEQRQTAELIRSQLETNTMLLELTRTRFGHGLSPATAVLQQEQQTLATRNILPQVEARTAVLEHRLALLLGRPPGEGTLLSKDALTWPADLTTPSTGIPAQLLTHRPDLKAAQLRVLSSDEDIGSALAARLPAFRIQATAGLGATSFAELLDRWVWSLAASMVAPIFDGGRRKAEVKRARAVLEDRLTEFKKVYLSALGEVEDALSLERFEHERFARLNQEVELARRLVEQSRARFLEGLGDYLPVITAIQSLQRSERNLVSSRRQKLNYRVQLYRALGGQWTASLKSPGTKGEKK